MTTTGRARADIMARERRDVSLDTARGIAIVGVVVNHVVRGMREGQLAGSYDAFLHQLDFAFYLPELVMFAFISGLFLPFSLQRVGRRSYLTARLTNLGYLYLVWTLIQGSVEVLSSSVKNSPTTWSQVVQIWNPLGHLWFLPWLAIATAVTVVTRPWERPTPGRAVVIVLAVVVSLTMWGVDGTAFYTRGMGLTMFMLFGAAVTRARWQNIASKFSTRVLIMGGVALVTCYLLLRLLPQATLPTATDPTRTPLSVAAGITFAVIACLGVLAACTASARTITLSIGDRALAYLGRQSLPVYVAHIIFAAGARVTLGKVGVTLPLVLFTVSFAAGIAGPLILERLTRSAPILFKPPWELHPFPSSRQR